MATPQVLLLIGNHAEQLAAVAGLFEEEALITTHQVSSLALADEKVQEILPDLIFLCADSLEASGENIAGFCRYLRENPLLDTGEYRPVITVETASEDSEKRINYLVNGSDDVFSTALDAEERRVRIMVHLRRNIDTQTSMITQLPGLMTTARILQRQINRYLNNPELPWACLSIELDRFDTYIEVYGHFPGNQVLKTFSALLARLILPPDFIGHLTETNTFIITTHPDRAEKIAAMLCRQFDTVAPNFYSEKDKKRGYIISVDEEHKVSRRVQLLALNIGIIRSQTQAFNNYQSALTAAADMRALARQSPGSTWVSDFHKLTGEAAGIQPEDSQILVVESDAALAYLLKSTLEMQSFKAHTVSDPEEALSFLQNCSTQLVILDPLLNNEPAGWKLCSTIKAAHPHTRVILASTLHDREKALSAGADLYLPKPFELIALFTWIERLLK